MGFSEDIEAFAKKSKERPEKLRRAVSISLFSAVVKDTPVGDPTRWKSPAPPGYKGGRARANWKITDGNPFKGTVTSTRQPSSGEISQQVLSASNRASIIFTNNLPYIGRLEYDGWSSQAPRGMVRHNVIRFKNLVKKELRKLK